MTAMGVYSRAVRLATRPNVTGSPPLMKTIGMVVVAAFAARSAGEIARPRQTMARNLLSDPDAGRNAAAGAKPANAE
jgi:hypothetical protein